MRRSSAGSVGGARARLLLLIGWALFAAAAPAWAQSPVVTNNDGDESNGSWRWAQGQVGPTGTITFSNFFATGERVIGLEGDVTALMNSGDSETITITATQDAAGNPLTDMLIQSADADPFVLYNLLELADGTTARVEDLDFGAGNIVLGEDSRLEIFTSAGRTNTISAAIVGPDATIFVDLENETLGSTGNLVIDSQTPFTGTTILERGRLTIQGASSTPSVNGNIVTPTDGADPQPILNFNLTSDSTFTYGGLIEGPMSIFKQGTGELKFSQAQTYTGAFFISQGKARGSIAAFPTGVVFDPSQGDVELIIEEACSRFAMSLECATFDERINGDGTFVVDGTSVLEGAAPTLVRIADPVSGDDRRPVDFRVVNGGLLGNSSSIQGDVSLEGTTNLGPSDVVFDQSFAGSYGGRISGPGTLVKYGSETLTLTGVNTHDMGTLVREGTLRATTFSLPETTSVTIPALGTLAGVDTAAGATLEFDQDSSGSWGGTVGGTGGLLKSGAGVVTLSNDAADPHTYTGGTEVRGGTLVLDAVPSGATVSGGRLVSRGTITGTLDVNEGSVLPGGLETNVADAIGELLVTDAVSFQGGSQLDVSVLSGTDMASRLNGETDVTIDPAAFVNVDRLGGTDAESTQHFPILSIGRTLTGRFAEEVQDDRAFLDFSLCYPGDPDNSPDCGAVSPGAVLLLMQPSENTPASFAESNNEYAVGKALEEAIQTATPGSDMALVGDQVRLMPSDQIRPMLISESAELITQTQSVRLANDHQLSKLLGRRLATNSRATLGDVTGFIGGSARPLAERGVMPPAKAGLAMPHSFLPRLADGTSSAAELGLGLWLDGYFVWGDLKGGVVPNGVDYEIFGTAMGADYRIGGDWIVGGALGYARSNLDFTLDDSEGHGDTFMAALYGGIDKPRYYAGAAFIYSYSSMETSRDILINELARTAESHPRGYTLSGYFEGGFNVWQVAGVGFQPTADVRLTYLVQNAMEERGAKSLNLRIDDQTMFSVLPELGIRIFSRFQVDRDFLFIPELRMGYGYEFGDRDVEFRAEISGANDPLRFRIQGVSPDRGRATLGAGWTISSSNGLHAYIGYDARLSQNLVEHTLGVGLGLNW